MLCYSSISLRRRILDHLVEDFSRGCFRAQWTRGFDSRVLLEVMSEQGVAMLWLSFLSQEEQAKLSIEFRKALTAEKLRQCALHQAAEVGLRQAGEQLDLAGIEWCVMKGGAFVLGLYEYPHHRPMLDLDLLVSSADFARAKLALCQSGLVAAVSDGQRAHEQNLKGRGFWIDLHSDLLGAGRSRVPLGRFVVEGRKRSGKHWIPDEVGTFLSLTAHPAITDYLSARLIRVIDLDRWVRQSKPNWSTCIAQAQKAGLSTPCWIMLEYTKTLLGTPIPGSVLKRLAPSSLRCAYLRQWLRMDPARVYSRSPMWARGAFQLLLADEVGDALRSVRVLYQESRS